MTLRTIECAGGCGYAPVVVVDHRYREPMRPEDVPGIVEELGVADVQQLVLAGADERDLTRLAEYQAVGGYGALEKARGMTPRGGHRGDLDGRRCAAAAAPASRWAGS